MSINEVAFSVTTTSRRSGLMATSAAPAAELLKVRVDPARWVNRPSWTRNAEIEPADPVLRTYARLPRTLMLTGVSPPDQTVDVRRRPDPVTWNDVIESEPALTA